MGSRPSKHPLTLRLRFATPPCGTDSSNYCQAAEWGAENPLLAACAAGAVAVVAPGLVTGPILSSLGFTAGGVQAGMCNIPEGD